MLERHFHVSYDSMANQGSFTCTTPPQGSVVFQWCPVTGFSFINLDAHGSKASIVMIQMLRQNFEGFTRQEVEHDIAARRAQALSGHSSEHVFKSEVSHKSNSSLFRSCPITKKDISNAHANFGPSMPCTRGKWVWRKSTRVEPDYISILASLISLYKYVTLAADVMLSVGFCSS